MVASTLEKDQIMPKNLHAAGKLITSDEAAAIISAKSGVIPNQGYGYGGHENGATNALTATMPGNVDTSKNITNVLFYAASNMTGYQTIINWMVATANQAYENSGVNLKLNVAGVIPITDPYPSTSEQNNLFSMLNAEMNNAAGSTSSPYAHINTDKANAKADFAVMVHPFNLNQGACGISYVNGGSGSAYSHYYTVAVVSYGTNNGYYCNDYVLPHELGHSMGMVHDSNDGGTATSGHYKDGLGYGLQGVYGCIMSYYPQVGLFSSPNLYWWYSATKSYPMGVAGVANVVNGLNVSAPQIIQFRNLKY